MDIHKGNYEIYFIDYYDGNLSPQQVADLFLFLEKNPELNSAFENFDIIKVFAGDVTFENKELLKKPVIAPENFHEFAVAYLEGDLDQVAQEDYRYAIEINPAFKKEHLLFSKTKLVADPAFVYPHKKNLKKNTGKVFPLSFSVYAVAASLFLIACVYFFNSFKLPMLQQADHNKSQMQKAVYPSTSTTESLNGTKSLQETVKIKTETNTLSEINTNNPAIAKVPLSNSPVLGQQKTHLAYSSGQSNSGAGLPIGTSTVRIFNPIATMPSLKSKTVNWITESISPIPLVYIENSYMLVMQPTLYTDKINPELRKAQEIVMEQAIKRLNSFAHSDETAETLPSSPKKLKLLAVVAAVVNKVTFQKVNIETTYTPDGNLSAYQVTAGKLNFEKQVSK